MSRYLRARPGGSMAFSAYAELYDGESADRYRVLLGEDDDGEHLTLEVPEFEAERWPFDSLRTVPDVIGEDLVIITSTVEPQARLMIRDEDTLRMIERNSPCLYKSPPVPGKGKIALWALAAMASVFLIIYVLVPRLSDQLALYLPAEGEKALGDTTLEQIRSAFEGNGFDYLRLCERPAGTRALQRMEARLLRNTDLDVPLTVSVLDHPMINAFALPGGHIVFFRGLLEEAQAPEEVAAVFAHEIGHVAAHDPTRIALRTAGSAGVLGLLLGDFAGGAVVLFFAERLIQADYTQEAEAAADAYAHAMLAASDIRPGALGDMFEHLRDAHGDAEGIVAHFMSHPALGDRIAAARAADSALSRPPRLILSETEWQALQSICE
ncbi:MAG: M48 family metallopeptidase [Pseudomonadota bacterium]